VTVLPPGDIHAVVNDDIAASLHVHGADLRRRRTSVRRRDTLPARKPVLGVTIVDVAAAPPVTRLALPGGRALAVRSLRPGRRGAAAVRARCGIGQPHALR
jgi:hypothetical protein